MVNKTSLTENQLINAALTEARTDLTRMRHQKEAMGIAAQRGELISKDLVAKQVMWLLVAFRQRMMNLSQTWARKFVGISDLLEAKRLLDEMARATLTELTDLPNCASPDWLKVAAEGEDGRPIRPATGADIAHEQQKAKIRRQKKTRTMRKLRAEGRA